MKIPFDLIVRKWHKCQIKGDKRHKGELPHYPKGEWLLIKSEKRADKTVFSMENGL